MTPAILKARLKKLTRYEPTIEYSYNGCSCCEPSSYSAMAEDVKGDYVRLSDVLKAVLKEKS